MKYKKVSFIRKTAGSISSTSDTNYLNIDKDRLLNEKELADLVAVQALRNGGELKNKAFYLNSQYQWNIIIDKDNFICLLPSKYDKNVSSS